MWWLYRLVVLRYFNIIIFLLLIVKLIYDRLLKVIMIETNQLVLVWILGPRLNIEIDFFNRLLLFSIATLLVDRSMSFEAFAPLRLIILIYI